jgi:hypothetical protein
VDATDIAPTELHRTLTYFIVPFDRDVVLASELVFVFTPGCFLEIWNEARRVAASMQDTALAHSHVFH